MNPVKLNPSLIRIHRQLHDQLNMGLMEYIGESGSIVVWMFEGMRSLFSSPRFGRSVPIDEYFFILRSL